MSGKHFTTRTTPNFCGDHWSSAISLRPLRLRGSFLSLRYVGPVKPALVKTAEPCHGGDVMKPCLAILPVLFVLFSCKKESTAEVPKAVEVKEEVIVVVDPPPVEPVPVLPDEAIVEERKTPGEHLDHALQKTGEGLQTAGEKTEHGLKVAREKTEAGIDKAAEKTGEFLKRVGEKIEHAGERAQEEE